MPRLRSSCASVTSSIRMSSMCHSRATRSGYVASSIGAWTLAFRLPSHRPPGREGGVFSLPPSLSVREVLGLLRPHGRPAPPQGPDPSTLRPRLPCGATGLSLFVTDREQSRGGEGEAPQPPPPTAPRRRAGAPPARARGEWCPRAWAPRGSRCSGRGRTPGGSRPCSAPWPPGASAERCRCAGWCSARTRCACSGRTTRTRCRARCCWRRTCSSPTATRASRPASCSGST